MPVYFQPLLPVVIPKLGTWLRSRPELSGQELRVSDGWLTSPRAVRIMVGASGPFVNLIDEPSVRVGIRVSDGLDGDALPLLTSLVRAYFDGPAADGDPIVYSRVTSGPVPVEAPTGYLEQYLVADLRRYGTELST